MVGALLLVLTTLSLVSLTSCAFSASPDTLTNEREPDRLVNKDNDVAKAPSGVTEKSSLPPSADVQPKATPDPNMAQAKATVESLVNESPYHIGISFIDLGNQANNFSVNGNRMQMSASMIKLGILAYAFHQIDTGALSLETTYELKSSDIVGGTGVLQGYAPGTVLTVSELIDLMISQSDNTASNILIDMLGISNINAYMKQLGLDVALNKRLMVTSPEDLAPLNYMTADAVSQLLKMIYDGTAGSAPLIELANRALLDQFDRVGVIDGVPAGTPVAHKTGSLSQARCDGAIVYGEHPYILTIMVEESDEGLYSEDEALQLMARISEIVYQGLYA